MQYVYFVKDGINILMKAVSAPDGTEVDGLKNVQIPPGLSIDIIDFDD